MAFGLTGLSISYPVPGTFIEVLFGQGVAAGDLSAKKVLIIAPSTSAGTIVQDTEVYGPFNDEAEVEAKTGSGSPAHRMARAFLAVNRSAQISVICPTRSAGTAATLAITIATVPTGAGVAKILFCEESVESAFASGDTVTAIAAALVSVFNAKTFLPATASAVAGVVTITAKVAGPEGNAFRAMPLITGGVGSTISPTVETAFAGGATAASYTNALSTIAALDYDLILPHTHSGTGSDPVLLALITQVGAQALPITGIRQKVIAGASLVPSTAVTLAQSLNKPRLDIVNLEESPLEPSVLAAIAGGMFANTHFVDPAYNLDGYGTKSEHIFPVLAPRNKGTAFTTTEQVLMLNGGVTPIGVSTAGTPYIVRQVTSKSLEGANPDYRTRDSHRVSVADKFADDLGAKMFSTPFRKITLDPPAGSDAQPPSDFATPSRIKSIIEQLVTDYTDAGTIDPAKKAATLAQITVAVDPINNTRMNIRCPIYSANLYHQSASIVAESSTAA